MARPRTQLVRDVRQQLVDRIRGGHHRPGQRFLSNRAIVQRFGVSYQTADLLVRELADDGLLVRRPASGTYLPGRVVEPSGIVLMFHRRARHKSSFGANLLDRLTAGLAKDRIAWKMSWKSVENSQAHFLRAHRDSYPVIWDRPEVIDAAIANGRTALALNDRPPAGLGATLIDSVSMDDFSGGAYAAQHLLSRKPGPQRMAILAGPADDQRSAARVAGFLSVANASVVTSSSWFLDGAMAVADRVLAAGPHGIFCCNDRLAQAVLRRAADRRLPRPVVVGFDDAPIAQWLRLTTIAIPWDEMVTAIVGVIKRRLSDPSSAAIAQLVSTRIVVRD
jgi:DNA-binding transcriptional regulator YhcF (GntR family)